MMVGCALSITAFLRRTPSQMNEPAVEETSTWKFSTLHYLVPICFTLSLGETFRNFWAGLYLKDVFGQRSDLGSVLSMVTVTYIVGFLRAAFIACWAGAIIAIASAGLAILYAMDNVHPDQSSSAVARSNARDRAWRAQNACPSGRLCVVFVGWRPRRTLSLSVAATYGLTCGPTLTALAIALVVYPACRPSAAGARTVVSVGDLS